ncbi:MAG TPA: EamA family transporter [Gemmatimonadota bacterium]|nr:EamA family transporter [Gemmatimonadota bacterium]
MTPQPIGERAALAAVIVACAVWGSSFLLAKVALRELAIGHLVLWRFVIAAAVLLPLVARRGFPRGCDLPRFILSGLLCVPITFLPQFEGLARTTVTSASLLVGTGTPLLALAGALFRRERPGTRGWIAVALSCLGLAIMVGLPGPGRTWLGDALVFVSMVTTTAWVLVMMPLVGRYGGLGASAWTVTFGAVFQIPVAWLDGTPALPSSFLVWGALLGLGVACTAGSYALWNLGLERVPPSRAGVYLNLEPVVGAALGVALLHEAVTGGLLAGGGLVLAASILASLPSRLPAAALPAEEQILSQLPERTSLAA